MTHECLKKVAFFFFCVSVSVIGVVAQTYVAPNEESKKPARPTSQNQKSLKELEIELEIKVLELAIERRKNQNDRGVNQIDLPGNVVAPISVVSPTDRRVSFVWIHAPAVRSGSALGL